MSSYLKKCIVCYSNTFKPIYSGILKCNNCGYICADLNIHNEDVLAFYNREYFFGNEYRDYLAAKDALQKNFKNRLKVIEKFTDPDRHSNLFEVGCAYGFFLDIARDSFKVVRGMDVVEDCVMHARNKLKLDVIQDNFLDYDFGEYKFDLLCMWDTIEHLMRPDLYLSKASNHMDKGALIALTTGNIDSFNSRIRKDRWRFIKPPEHIHYFSKRTLTKMLDNYGFDIIYNRYCANFMSIENIAYKLFVLNNKAQSFYDFLSKTGLFSFYLYINLFDIMYVIARKR